MIELKGISKYYYSKGMVASGISNVSLHFDIGEFVVITGESGSGKTTLLNVISGLDSYEEGEMYISGQETSHYAAADFEAYRKRYIGNIFQDFHLVNSYTVYQNVELTLLINGYSREEIKKRAPRIIDRVGLSSHAKVKVSKLSGGQKQRVAIARALAKDTDIIVADEPTGNLDSEAAESIAQLLSEIAEEKLVIVVTHNYEQFAPYATRKIKMHDGKVAEDSRPCATVSQNQQGGSAATASGARPGATSDPAPATAAALASSKGDITAAEKTSDNMTAAGQILLGMRNTFNILPKFLLLLLVFLFVVFSVTALYTTLQHQEAEEDKLGFSNYFTNYSEDRVVLKKIDGSSFTDDDHNAIANVANVENVVLDDIMLDNSIYIEEGDFSYQAYPRVLDAFDGKLAAGRMPEAENEAILTAYEDEYYFNDDTIADLLDKTYHIALGEDKEIVVTVVGCAYKPEADEYDALMYCGDLYVTNQLMDTMRKEIYNFNSTVKTTINGKEQEYQQGNPFYRIVPSANVAQGTVVGFEELNNFFDTVVTDESAASDGTNDTAGTAVTEPTIKKGQAKGQTITITAENMYYIQAIDLIVAEVYNKKNFTALTGVTDYDMHNGTLYINQVDYDALFLKGNYQATVYVEDVKQMDGTCKALETMGYTTLPLKKTLIRYMDDISSIIKVPMAVILVLAIFFVAYFVIRLILKSRVIYFSILRMLGLARRNIRRIMDVEIILVTTIAYALFLGCVALVRSGVLKASYLIELIQYMHVTDYVLLYAIVLVMALLISGKFARSLFQKTAMGTFREGDR